MSSYYLMYVHKTSLNMVTLDCNWSLTLHTRVLIQTGNIIVSIQSVLKQDTLPTTLLGWFSKASFQFHKNFCSVCTN